MTGPASPVLPEPELALCILLILLTPFALVGLSLINTGLSRSRSAAHAMFTPFCTIAVAVFAYFLCGFAWQGYPAQTGLAAGGRWDWLGSARPFFNGIDWAGSRTSLVVLLQTISVSLAVLIPLGSGAERWRLSATCLSSALFAGWTYPLFAHWVWGGGWLAQLGVNYGLGRGFIDAGGSGVIQAVGGLTALAVTWILGPRRGKFSPDGMPAAIPGHNAVLVLFGCLLALAGWLGLNSAGAILFTGIDPRRTVLIAVNTIFCAISGSMAAALITRVRFGKPDASLSANGWMAGLVASSAGCAFLSPEAALVVGFVAGVLVILGIELLELRFGVDDPGGAISVHAFAGIWGVLAVGIFGEFPVVTGAAASVSSVSHQISGQWVAQLVGVATLLGLVFPLTYGLNWLLHRFYPQRVAAEGEWQGMDLHELGAGAYPEFITHTEEFPQR